jgi:hypothetical protein
MLSKLLTAILCTHSVCKLFLHALLLALSIRLLLVRHLRRFHEIDKRLLGQAKAARIVSRHLRIAIVHALLAHPVHISVWSRSLVLPKSEALSMDGQLAMRACNRVANCLTNGAW